MGETLFMLSADCGRADEMAEPYRARGWRVVTGSPGDDGILEAIVEAHPLAAVFCLDSTEGEAIRSLVARIGEHPDHINPMLVFYGGSADEVALVKQAAPYGAFVNPDEVDWVLKHLSFKG